VGCRDQCDGGYSSSINTCQNGVIYRPRVDTRRSGVAPKLQSSPSSDSSSKCPTGYVPVSRVPRGIKRGKVKTHRGGGCCPSTAPILIEDKCYPDCPENQDAIIVAKFVGCRAHCPDGWNEDRNECTHEPEEPVERSDFPRTSSEPVDRLPQQQTSVTTDGCTSGYVAASSNYCCPVNRPQLKGLLCYQKCGRGWDESGYGCRHKCPRGWTTTTLTCHRRGRVISRKGFERHPVPSKSRSKQPTTTTTTTDPTADAAAPAPVPVSSTL